MLGAIEAGGTKFVCAVSDYNFNIIDKISIPTTYPKETFENTFRFFDKYKLDAIGIGSFGPIETNKNSDSFGFITSTPKKLWRNTDFLGIFKERYKIPIGWNTDVNVAALGEITFGAAKKKDSCVYVTVGTGIGGGAFINQKLLTGYGHPEMGHLLVQRHEHDTFKGVCDYHNDCLEGLASGPAIEMRFDSEANNLPEKHIVWEIEAHYLAQAAMAYTLILRPDCIIFGGGVMNQRHLFDLIKIKFLELINDYVELPPIDEYIIPTGLKNDSGIIGSLLLAKSQLK